MASAHRILRFLLPARIFAAVEAGTRQWVVECKCGYRRDRWDLGGVKYKSAGQQWKFRRCPKCGRWSWHGVRKKTEEERRAGFSAYWIFR